MTINDSDNLRELIRVLVRKLGILDKSEVECSGTTISKCHAIVEIGRAKEISLNELAKLLELDKSTMSRTINNLVSEEIVIRHLDENDRRYITIKLSEKGVAVFKDIEGSMMNYYKNILSLIPISKREQVLESLSLIIDAIRHLQ